MPMCDWSSDVCSSDLNPHLLCLLLWQVGSLPPAPPEKPNVLPQACHSKGLEITSPITVSTGPCSPYRSAQNQRLLGGWEAVSLEAECQSQGAGWHSAHTSHPGRGAFLLEPMGLSPGLLPSPREMEHTLFLLVFKDRMCMAHKAEGLSPFAIEVFLCSVGKGQFLC